MCAYTLQLEQLDEELVFETEDDVFFPTDTSTLLIEGTSRAVTTPKKALDLGCGSGVVGITLSKLGLVKPPLHASDLSETAAGLTRRNAEKAGVDCEARYGSMFDPWEGERFELIVDDVAGISDPIAECSSWYPPGVSCNAGRDGTKWIVDIIKASPNYLTEDGLFIFPLLTLSNGGKILDAVKATYPHHACILKKDWFLPDDIAQHQKLVESLLEDASIHCEKKFGKWIWSTLIYAAAFQPINPEIIQEV